MDATTEAERVRAGRQAEALRFVADYWGRTGQYPVLREISDALGLSGPSSAANLVQTLLAKGRLRLFTRAGRQDLVVTRGYAIPELVEAARAAADRYLEGLS